MKIIEIIEKINELSVKNIEIDYKIVSKELYINERAIEQDIAMQDYNSQGINLYSELVRQEQTTIEELKVLKKENNKLIDDLTKKLEEEIDKACFTDIVGAYDFVNDIIKDLYNKLETEDLDELKRDQAKFLLDQNNNFSNSLNPTLNKRFLL
jgi:hypothetical protein